MRRLLVTFVTCAGIGLLLTVGFPARSALAQRATTDSNGAQDTIANGYLATIAAAVGSGASEATLAALNVLTGAVTETAPATDTASSGLNGRLQRIAQRVTTLITAVGTPFQAGGSIANTSFSAPVADGGNVTLGAKADAKASTSDATPITAMQVLKQISFSMQAAVTALGSPFQAGGSIGNSAFGATQSGTWTVQPGNTANTTAWLMKLGDNTNTKVIDPCEGQTKVYTPISQATSTQVITGTSAKKLYICDVLIVVADAENVSLVAGTGSVCGTNTVAVIGGTTAATGPNMVASGGFQRGNGTSSIAATTVNADNLCLLQSGSGRIAGGMTSVVQ